MPSSRWRGDGIPDKVGTVKVKSCVTLKPRSEHLVWGKLPESAVISVGSTVVVEPTQSKPRPRHILVGRVVTPLWGDRWVPVKVVNPTDRVVCRIDNFIDYRVKDTLTGRERVVHRNLLLSVSFLPGEQDLDSGSTHSQCGATIQGSAPCSDIPEVMEGSDVRTANWLLQASEDVVSSEDDDDPPDQRSDVTQSDCLTVATTCQTSHLAPDHGVVHPIVDCAESPPQRSDNTVSPDFDPPDVDVSPSDSIPFGTAPLDDDSAGAVFPDTGAAGIVVLASDCPETGVLGPLDQVVCTQPSRHGLRLHDSVRPPKRLICEMNNQVVDADLVHAV